MQNVITLSHPELRSLSSSLHILKFPGDQTKRSIKLYQATKEKSKRWEREREREGEKPAANTHTSPKLSIKIPASFPGRVAPRRCDQPHQIPQRNVFTRPAIISLSLSCATELPERMTDASAGIFNVSGNVRRCDLPAPADEMRVYFFSVSSGRMC